jgi:hypothetical protein
MGDDGDEQEIVGTQRKGDWEDRQAETEGTERREMTTLLPPGVVFTSFSLREKVPRSGG